MAKGLIQHFAAKLKSYPSKVFLVENSDRFLYRQDVVSALNSLGIEVSIGSNIEQRLKFEIREKDGLLILLSQTNANYLEDIKQQSSKIEFRLDQLLPGYHLPSVINFNLDLLDKLFMAQPMISLDKRETLQYIQQITVKVESNLEVSFDANEFASTLNGLLSEDIINWSVVSRIIARGILETIGKPEFEKVFESLNKANLKFQETLKSTYHQTRNSSAVKKPRIVSKILDHLDFNYQDKKIALIVVDGMAFWQYELLRDQLPGTKDEEVIYSWLPSITQLSRQAIFRGDTPITDYRQGPVSEEKLWKNYWKSKGLHDFEIDYQHETVNLRNLDQVSKLAIVFKDLDEKMHSSTDYIDLLMLTKNWIVRSNIFQVIQGLLQKGFIVFLTSDHGNIQAKGWRGLKGREKLGTNKSGSRSERHIEYSEKWLYDEFLENNPELKDSVVIEDQSIYFKSDLSFSNKDSLVSHGGAHLLEVLIPFVKIMNHES